MPNPEISLERTSTKPLFAQVAQSLNTSIASGGFRPGQQIPTEPELAATYGVSRITVRRAIEELCQHGLLIKRQGKGTFVRESKTARKIAAHLQLLRVLPRQRHGPLRGGAQEGAARLAAAGRPAPPRRAHPMRPAYSRIHGASCSDRSIARARTFCLSWSGLVDPDSTATPGS